MSECRSTTNRLWTIIKKSAFKMSGAPTKQRAQAEQYKTTKKSDVQRPRRTRMLNLKAIERAADDSSAEEEPTHAPSSSRVVSQSNSDEDIMGQLKEHGFRISMRQHPAKGYKDLKSTSAGQERTTTHRAPTSVELTDEDEEQEMSGHDAETLEALPSIAPKPTAHDLQLLHEGNDVAGKSLYGFNTPKKRNAMTLAALNTPRTPKVPKTPSAKTPGSKGRNSDREPKTPSHIRQCVKNQIAKLVEQTNSESDFSADSSDFVPSSDGSTMSEDGNDDSDTGDDEPRTPLKCRRPILVPVLPKTPSAARLRQAARSKKSADYVPESDGYFQAHSSSKIITSDHTLDRLKNPRLPADRLFSLLAAMKLSTEHECSINAIMEEYCSYFPKWMCLLNEDYNILVYGLGSKRQLLQSFHRAVLDKQTVLVVNGFFPSLTLKDVLDSITSEILDAGPSPANAHEAVDMIEEEFALIPDTHLYLVVHNLDGTMLRNGKAQAILSRLAKVQNIHLLASIDHINTPLLWDHTKLSNYNFSWWDCTTMLPYTEETAFENSLLVQNSGELALSSMRSVFSSLTTNSRGIYMLIVKFQLKEKGNQNYQGMAFKDLYWSCREAFLVSSDLALRAQLTEFLDHKLVKSKRSADGSEQLIIPIDSLLLQQFLDEQEKK